jgi:hypothetical protein
MLWLRGNRGGHEQEPVDTVSRSGRATRREHLTGASVHPPKVSHLHHRFEGWLGDDCWRLSRVSSAVPQGVVLILSRAPWASAPCRPPRAQTCRTAGQVQHMRPPGAFLAASSPGASARWGGASWALPLSPTHRCAGPVPLGSQVQGPARTGPIGHASGGPSARCGAPVGGRLLLHTGRPALPGLGNACLAFNPLEGLGERPDRTCPTVGQVCFVPGGLLDTRHVRGRVLDALAWPPRTHTCSG